MGWRSRMMPIDIPMFIRSNFQAAQPPSSPGFVPRACKKSWLCDFCHGPRDLSAARKPRRGDPQKYLASKGFDPEPCGNESILPFKTYQCHIGGIKIQHDPAIPISHFLDLFGARKASDFDLVRFLPWKKTLPGGSWDSQREQEKLSGFPLTWNCHAAMLSMELTSCLIPRGPILGCLGLDESWLGL